jgi:hypothetical protein
MPPSYARTGRSTPPVAPDEGERGDCTGSLQSSRPPALLLLVAEAAGHRDPFLAPKAPSRAFVLSPRPMGLQAGWSTRSRAAYVCFPLCCPYARLSARASTRTSTACMGTPRSRPSVPPVRIVSERRTSVGATYEASTRFDSETDLMRTLVGRGLSVLSSRRCLASSRPTR